MEEEFTGDAINEKLTRLRRGLAPNYDDYHYFLLLGHEQIDSVQHWTYIGDYRTPEERKQSVFGIDIIPVNTDDYFEFHAIKKTVLETMSHDKLTQDERDQRRAGILTGKGFER